MGQILIALCNEKQQPQSTLMNPAQGSQVRGDEVKIQI